ncbi:MAG: bifunctional methylenetetrahydrofolate dehydrogenase/methenyltetrahydrofolate cyclohydrolase [Cellulomonadaceae bacterium]|jgi:methylenetetrahydrofolate dehydrogenase (NADP+)/methenyltetrahydrofolate cyclohydrolase|nr:bifunctional methylenetetrahydrofolate dehydrogenase/methenyltetrahydrofolate cyclohydrolase [Cellulomonadaceae bacterium]
MGAMILDGKATAAQVKAELKERVTALRAQGTLPGLGTLLVGADPASQMYVAGKHRDCREVGIESIRIDLPASASQKDVERAIHSLNENPTCTAFIVQLPLPEGIDKFRMLELVDPDKDADGLHPTNLGRLVLRAHEPMTSPLPCTPRGIVELCQRNGINLAGMNVAVLGRGTTVGRPMSLVLSRMAVNSTVTMVHTGTKNPEEIFRNSDMIVAAVGDPGHITADMVKPGAVLIDVGVSRVTDPETGKSRIAGDIDPAARELAGWYTPNPGGVGPMTRAMLLSNVVDAAECRAHE